MGLTKKELQASILERKQNSLLNNFKLTKLNGSIYFEDTTNSFYTDNIYLIMKSRYGITTVGIVSFKRSYTDLEIEINKILSNADYIPDQAYTIDKGYGKEYEGKSEYDIKDVADLNYVVSKFYEVIETKYSSFFEESALFKNIYNRVISIPVKDYNDHNKVNLRTYDLHVLFIKYIGDDLTYFEQANEFKSRYHEQIILNGGYNTIADSYRLELMRSIKNIDELLLRIDGGDYKELKEKYAVLLT